MTPWNLTTSPDGQWLTFQLARRTRLHATGFHSKGPGCRSAWTLAILPATGTPRTEPASSRVRESWQNDARKRSGHGWRTLSARETGLLLRLVRVHGACRC